MDITLEETKNIYLEGAKGSEEIKKIMDSFRETPPTKIGSLSVQKIVDFNIPDSMMKIKK